MSFEKIIRSSGQQFAAVIPLDPQEDKLLHLDFTENNTELTGDVLRDTTLFSAYIDRKLTAASARYGIGGYNEHRTVYSRSKVFDAAVAGEEPRRLHLGTDIWGKPYTPVMAPLDGIIHSFAFNSQFGDYGATIILAHRLNGFTFHTLYGHLSLASLKNLRGGEVIRQGEVFAGFGIPNENGHWPPHLHFQVVIDMGDRSGDYPGVCRYSERAGWLKNSPDPAIILGLGNGISQNEDR